MKITKVEVFPVSIPWFPKPHRSAGGTFTVQEDTVIKIHTDQGLVGLGEAVYRPNLAGTQEINVLVLSKYFAPALIGENPLEIARIIQKLGGADCPYLPALHAVDIALYDILGKATGQPLYRLLGGKTRESMGVSRSLPLGTPEEAAERAIALKEKGYKLLTVKIGMDSELDGRRILAVKKAVGDWPPVEADINGAYTVDVAIKTLKRLEGVIDDVEQPVAPWDLFGMARVCEALDMPVIADQGMITPRDVSLTIRLEAADQICLKLAERGGITLANECVTIAKAANIPVSTGSAWPMGIGTAALHHWAIANDWVRPPIGYGTPLERYNDDIITEPVHLKNGEVTVSDKPGLGVELDEKKMAKYATKITIKRD